MALRSSDDSSSLSKEKVRSGGLAIAPLCTTSSCLLALSSDTTRDLVESREAVIRGRRLR